MCKTLSAWLWLLGSDHNMGSPTEQGRYDYANPFRNKHWYCFAHTSKMSSTRYSWEAVQSWLYYVIFRILASHPCFPHCECACFYQSFRSAEECLDKKKPFTLLFTLLVLPLESLCLCQDLSLLVFLHHVYFSLCVSLILPLLVVLLSSQKCSCYWCTPMHSIWQEQTAWKEKLLK